MRFYFNATTGQFHLLCKKSTIGIATFINQSSNGFITCRIIRRKAAAYFLPLFITLAFMRPVVCLRERTEQRIPALPPIEDVANDSAAAAVAIAPAAMALLIPAAPPSANVVAPVVAAARPAEKAPLNKLEAADCPVVIAF